MGGNFVRFSREALSVDWMTMGGQADDFATHTPLGFSWMAVIYPFRLLMLTM